MPDVTMPGRGGWGSTRHVATDAGILTNGRFSISSDNLGTSSCRCSHDLESNASSLGAVFELLQDS
jgi:hypothetical protein